MTSVVEILRPTSIDGSALWDSNAYTSIDGEIVQPDGPGDAEYIQSGKYDDLEEQKYNCAAPTYPGTITAVKLWAYGFVGKQSGGVANSSYKMNISIGGSWQTEKNCDLPETTSSVYANAQWKSYEWTGLSVATGSASPKFSVKVPNGVGTTDHVRIYCAYLEITTDIGTVTETILYPNGDGTNVSSLTGVGNTTNRYANIDEGTTSPNDSDYNRATTGTTDNQWFYFRLTDLSSDAVTVKALKLSVRTRYSGYYVFDYMRILKSNESTALTDVIGNWPTGSADTHTVYPRLTGDTDKASWDGAVLAFQLRMDDDYGYADILAAQLHVWYTTGSSPPSFPNSRRNGRLLLRFVD